MNTTNSASDGTIKEVCISWSKFKELHKMGMINPEVMYNVYHDKSNKLV